MPFLFPISCFVTVKLAFHRHHFNELISRIIRNIHRVTRRICEFVEWRESKLLYRKPLIIGKSLDNPGKGKVGCGACIRYSLMLEASVDWPTLRALGENFFSAAHIICQSHCQTHIQGLNSGNNKAGKKIVLKSSEFSFSLAIPI